MPVLSSAAFAAGDMSNNTAWLQAWWHWVVWARSGIVGVIIKSSDTCGHYMVWLCWGLMMCTSTSRCAACCHCLRSQA